MLSWESFTGRDWPALDWLSKPSVPNCRPSKPRRLPWLDTFNSSKP